jgi:ribonuclease HIII
MAKKYYADQKGKYRRVVDSWSKCEELRKQYKGTSFKSFPSFEAAQAYLDSWESPEVKRQRKIEAVNAGCGMIGGDEVGKVEPFKQAMTVAVYADPDIDRSKNSENYLPVKDSKKLTPEEVQELGKLMTDFKTYEDVEDRVYVNEKYGLIYYIKIIPNEVYNRVPNINVLLSYAHNEAFSKVYEEVRARGKKLSHMVIDDFIDQDDSIDRFRAYVREFDKNADCIADLEDAELVMLKEGEDAFGETVGAASCIGAYVDRLWRNKVTELFREKKIEFQSEWFGNFEGQADVNRVFALIEEKYGDIDNSPILIKHTKYYETWKNRR